MPKFSFFNDSKREIHIHPATESHGTKCDMSPIKPLEVREFELPEGTYAWVKQWDNGTILVSPTRDDKSEDDKPKHFGKYPVEFSFTEPETGKRVLDYINAQLKTPDLDTSAYSMLRIMKNQIVRHLESGDA